MPILLSLIILLCWGLSPWIADAGLLIWVALIALAALQDSPRWGALSLLGGTAIQLFWVLAAWRDGQGESGLYYWIGLSLWQWAPLAGAVLLTWLTKDRLGLPVASGLAWSSAQFFGDSWQFFPASAALFLADTHYWLWPASIGGTPLLTGLIAALSAWAFTAPRPALTAWIGWGLIGIVLPALGGTESMRRVGVIQPDVQSLDARRPSLQTPLEERILSLFSRAEREGAELLLAPEGAWPTDPGSGAGSRRQAFLTALKGHPPLAVGATVGRQSRTNSVLGLENGVLRRVNKHTLVPIWERALWGLGTELYQPGGGRPVLNFRDLSIGVLICYEDGFPERLRQVSGADLLLAPTNDSWLGAGAGSRTHLNAARLAAVLTGTWLVRPALSGRSAVFSRWGQSVWSAPWIELPYSETSGHVGVVEVGVGPGEHPGVWTQWWVGLSATLGLAWTLWLRARESR